MEDIQKALNLVGGGGRADLHGYWIANAPEELDVRSIGIGCTHPDPREMRGQIVIAGAPGNMARLSLLIKQVQPFVASEEIHPIQLAGMHAQDALHES